ncbi:DUF3536 domain-containing protein [Geobacter sp.]|uniref:DUF3536 domain-containing protein n=1 Tax=Geobacter sp. TaxID=46610 RepID=UPI001ACD2834|nr:DUF3536 domain-containing protein [Geobacter sp.]CAG0976904.1 hypothetical protein GEOBC_01590 [Geobacteraceae bacterium]
MSRHICIHGHFYQPPRENPWLEAVEIQDSAHPYHDWNERITAECYAPNGASRLFDGEGRIRDIVSNYARISFNFGPTLLAWMEEYSPEVYRAILEADRLSIGWRSGHGNALAQVYNHLIMPLANRRDRETQVRWGIADFERHFGRFPEGMWLAETAVDTETLDVLAAEGIRFTILAPHQARRIRPRGGRKWHSVEGGHIDPTMPYLCRLPSGRSIVIFFYDGPISRAVAFEKLLDQGERFAERLLSGFDDRRNRPQVLSIATDGETYGHHHMHGDMALAYALSYLEDNGLARLTNYGEFLEIHPPSHEVEIVEQSSWSCSHGIERWQGDCRCNSGGYPHWNQQWRGPLRHAFDWLRDELAGPYEMVAGALLRDPWQARDHYIGVMLDRSPEQVDAFFHRHALRPLAHEERTRALKLLEMQRHLLLMYTSCGWFFDELSGIETVQVIQYAGRAVQLARELFCNAIEASFLQRLAAVRGNIPEYRDGASIYEAFVRPAMIDLVRVGAHYAVSSLFQEYGDETRVFSYRVRSKDSRHIPAGQTRLAIGRVLVSSVTTGERDQITYCVLYFGNHALNGGVRSFRGEEAYGAMAAEITRAFEASDFAEIIRLMDAHFGMHNYSLRDLFRDEQRRILGMVIGGVLTEFEDRYTALYDNNRLLMGFVRQTGMPVPNRFMTTAQVALNLKLDRAFAKSGIAGAEIEELLREIADWGVEIDRVDLEFQIRRRLEKAMAILRDDPLDRGLLAEAAGLLELAGRLPIDLNLWLAQNIYLEIARPRWRELMERSRGGDARNDWWFEEFRCLGERLNFNTHTVLPPVSEE